MDSRPMVDPTNWQHHSVQHVSDTQGVFDTNASGDLSMSSTDGLRSLHNSDQPLMLLQLPGSDLF